MRLARIDLMRGKPAEYRRTVGEVVYDAMIAALNVPKDDRFQIIAEHEAAALVIDPTYLGIQRSGDCIIIQVTLNEGRSLEVKRSSTRPSQMDCMSASACGAKMFSSISWK
jgi:4-oxalocrotonate tautomerase